MIRRLSCLMIVLLCCSTTLAQEESTTESAAPEGQTTDVTADTPEDSEPTTIADDVTENSASAETAEAGAGGESVLLPEEEALNSDPLEQAKESATGLVDDAKKHLANVAETVDSNPQAQKASTSILEPIYEATEHIAFPAFYWVAFSLMSAGIVSYAFQLVLGKLIVLAKGSINIREILSDAVGLLTSAIGLVLTTQAATDHSTFADSPSNVLSAAGVGVVAGLVLYRWNQAEEVDAARGRKKQKRAKK